MTPLTVTVAAFMIAITLGAAVVWGTPVFGLPIIAVVLLVLAGMELRRRVVRERDIAHHREDAQAEKVEFTERDKETLT